MNEKSARRREARTLAETARVLRSIHDVRSLSQALAETIAGTRRHRDVFVYEFDATANELVLVGATESPAARHAGSLRVPFGEGVTGWVAASRASYAVYRDPALDPRFLPYPDIGEERYGAIFSVPIVSSRDELLGGITVWAARGHILDDFEVPLVEKVATFAASAFENARLRDADARRADAHRALSMLGSAAVTTSNAMDVVELATELARDVSGADIAIAFVTDQQAADRVIARFAPTQAASTLPALGESRTIVADTERAVRHGRISWRQAYDDITRSLQRSGWTAFSAAMRIGADDLGVLCCYHLSPTRLSSDAFATVTAIANQAAVVTQLSIVTAENRAGSAFNWFVRDIAFGGRTTDELRRRAWELGMEQADAYVFLATQLVESPRAVVDSATAPVASRLPHLLGSLPGLSASTLYASMEQQTVAAIPWSSAGDPSAVLRAPLTALVAKIRASTGAVLTAGISRPVRGIENFAEALSEAREAVAAGSTMVDGGGVFDIDDIGHDVLFNRVSGAVSVRDKYAIAVARMAEYDRVRGTDLLETVATFLHLRSQSAAARQLYVHRNTLNQRLERASELGGLDVASPAEWFPLQLALKVHQARDAGAPEPRVQDGQRRS